LIYTTTLGKKATPVTLHIGYLQGFFIKFASEKKILYV